ncbi:MAG: hypothetical protein IPJ67_02775 [Candidatus Moraniibacteriota bacterium]|nr:MAG: hypothetical protein IPJ67_02775 [Candidatus Moranbacteria bacterium]
MNVLTSFFSFVPGKFAGDLSFLLLFIGGSLALSFVLGRTRLLSVVVFSYVALALVLTVPASWIAFAPEGRAIIFVVLLAFLVMVGDYILDIHISNPTSTFFSRVLVMGCLGTGLAMSMALSLVSRSFALRFLSPTVYGYFSDSWARLVWMAAPLVFLLFVNKRRR